MKKKKSVAMHFQVLSISRHRCFCQQRSAAGPMAFQSSACHTPYAEPPEDRDDAPASQTPLARTVFPYLTHIIFFSVLLLFFIPHLIWFCRAAFGWIALPFMAIPTSSISDDSPWQDYAVPVILCEERERDMARERTGTTDTDNMRQFITDDYVLLGLIW